MQSLRNRIDSVLGDGSFREDLGRVRESWRVPGVSLTVVSDDTATVVADGFRDPASGARMTSRTLFPLGSLNKSVIAALVSRLVNQGMADWDTGRLTGLLPQGAPPDGYTLTQLLTHSSGLPSYDMLLAGCSDTSARDVALHRLAHLVTVREPTGERFSYSDLAYLMACHIAEEAAQRPWAELTADFLAAIGARDAYQGSVPTAGEAAHAHELNAEGEFIGEGPPPVSPLSVPISGVWASAADMAGILRLHLFGQGENGPLMDAEALEHLRKPFSSAPRMSANHPVGIEAEGYTHGWLAGEYQGDRALVHSSSVGALRGMTVLLPERRVGVNVFCNTAVRHSPGSEHCCFRCAVAFAVLDAVLGRTDRAEPRLRVDEPERMARRTMGREADLEAFPGLQGTYENPGFGAVTIERSERGPGALFRYGSVEGTVRQGDRGALFTMCPADPGPIALGQLGPDAISVRMERSVPAFTFTRTDGGR